MMDAEKHVFDEQVDFLQLLTNACFNPELSGATRVTQALAVSISQPWIVEAHDTFTAQSRNRVPHTIELSIDEFNTTTTNGSNEQELLQQQDRFYEGILATALGKLSFPYAGIIVGALICLLGLWAFGFHPVAVVAGLGIGGVLIWNAINSHNKAKDQVIENVAERKRKAREVLRGCLAETVDYRKELTLEDSNAEKVRQLLTSITPEDFSSVSKAAARSII
jgi:hypothetical protein